MQYLGNTYLKKNSHYLSEILIYLGVLCFYLLNLATLAGGHPRKCTLSATIVSLSHGLVATLRIV